MPDIRQENQIRPNDISGEGAAHQAVERQQDQQLQHRKPREKDQVIDLSFIYLSIYPSIYLLIYLPIYQSIHLSIFLFFTSIYL